MMNELTKLATKPLTRRRFLEGMGAAGAAATLASCGGSKGVNSLFEEKPTTEIPAITGAVVAGSAAHNCGGRCVTKAYVENGVIKRFVTDENPETGSLVDMQGDNPQRRACPRCRAQKGFMYRADRLMKPLKQTGTRGDVNGFVEISWDQAFTEIATQTKDIKNRFGASALYNHYTSGDGAAVPRGGAGNDGGTCVAQRVLRLLGGYVGFRQDYSYPSLGHTASFCLGTNGGTPPASAPQDTIYAEQIILWAKNSLEMIDNTNTGYYLTQARDRGVPVIVIDNRVSQTMATIATEQHGIISGTDSAMVLAMIYHLLAEPTLAGGAAGSLLDPAFIRKYVHGFYDEPAPTAETFYRADVLATGRYVVPNGASFSAYIMGNNPALVTAGLNGATSVYPETIGYDVNATDPLFGKRTPVFGQVPKTPEWAEKITGVPAATIRRLAESIATKKTHLWIGGGLQRNVEGEQPLMALYALGAITKNFGVNGRTFGMPGTKTSAGGLAMPRINGESPVGNREANLPAGYYDLSKCTAPAYMWQRTRFSFPCFTWPDVVKNGGTGTSDWNEAQTKKLGPIKAFYNFAGNCMVNQTGDANYMRQILSDRSKAELIVVTDHYMTASAAMADYLLPAATAFERTAANSGAECLIYMGKAVEPLGQALSDYNIGVGIAKALGTDPVSGKTYEEIFTDGKTEEGWVKAAWDANNFTNMTYAEWQQKGIRTSNTPPSTLPTPQYNTYLANPATAMRGTPSGKIEIYAQSMVEDYEARGYGNRDDSVALGGPLHDGQTYGRYVYPIAMYIPLIEGRHSDERPSTGDVTMAGTGGIPHPDPLGAKAQGFTLMLQTWHMQYRSHSTHGSNAYLNEVYKRDATGKPAFLSPQRPRGAVWDAGVYEPVWINPATAAAHGIVDGNRVLVSSLRGKIYASAVVTQRAQPGFVHIGQGAWHSPDANGIDVGGCANTLTSARPTRICQGMTLASGTLVKLEKA